MANTYTANASLPKPIDESQIMQDMENLQTAFNTAMDILEDTHYSAQSAALAGANSSIIASGGKSVVYLQHLSIGSFTTITGMVQGKPTTFIFQSIGSYNFVDTTNWVLGGGFSPGLGDSITLIWDGIQYIEVCRSNN